MTRFLICALACTSSLLSACAIAPKPAAPTTAHANGVLQWDGTRTGRISVRAADARGTPQSWHAGFEFVEQGQSRTLRLTDPLGSTLAKIESDAAGARMTTSNGEQSSYGSLAELTQRVTGVALPESAWRYWLMGVPAPDQPASLGYVDGFLQAGFIVRVASRQDNGTPRVVDITRPDSPDLAVRVALDAAP
jgi:outer membrane lipoprotein LolB